MRENHIGNQKSARIKRAMIKSHLPFFLFNETNAGFYFCRRLQMQQQPPPPPLSLSAVCVPEQCDRLIGGKPPQTTASVLL